MTTREMATLSENYADRLPVLISTAPPQRLTRLSTDTRDCWRYEVLLDDEPIDFCMFADEQFGIVVCADMVRENSSVGPVLRQKKDADMRYKSIVRYGRVEIRHRETEFGTHPTAGLMTLKHPSPAPQSIIPLALPIACGALVLPPTEW